MNRDEHSPESSAGERRCRECGAVLAQDTRYCPECGTAASDACPSCGEQLHPGERFCRYCGTQVTAFAGGEPFSSQSPSTPPGNGQPTGNQAPEPVSSTPPEPDLRDAGRPGASSYRPPDPGGFTCPRCGERATAEDVFCNSCGLPFDEQPESYGAQIQRSFNYAGVLERFVARLIDGFILFAILIVVFMAAGTDWVVRDETLTLESVAVTSGLIILYHSIFIAIWGATPGKRTMSLRVVSANGRTPPFPQALARELVAYLSTNFFFIGHLVALFRPDRRTLHDLLAGTVVIHDRS